VGLAEAAFLDDGQDDRRLVVVDADEVVVKLAQEVLRVPQGLGAVVTTLHFLCYTGSKS
jgi:hypothetical protein